MKFKNERDYSTNLPKLATSEFGVAVFLRQNQNDIEKSVGGLLDYGYDVYQISDMLGIDSAKVRRIMQYRGYKLYDGLNPTREAV